MTEAKQKNEVRPLASDLPSSRIIWSGMVRHLNELVPARVVAAWEWWRKDDKSDWEVRPKYAYEVAATKDLLMNPRFDICPLTDLPADFFIAVLSAFDRATA